MMSIDIKNIEVEVKGRFTSLTLRGVVSYGFCHDFTLGMAIVLTAFSVPHVAALLDLCSRESAFK